MAQYSMQYHQNIIHAHRPYMSKTYNQPFPPQGPGSNHARMMCVGSAISIAKLLQLYEVSYELRRINVQTVGIACSAALLLIFTNVTRYQPDDGQTEAHLNTCFRALDEFSLSWDSAKRAREFLLLLQRQWELRVRPVPTRRASEFTVDHPDMGPRKRTRTFVSDELPPRSQHQPQMANLPYEAAQFGSQQGSLGIDTGLDLDWIVNGFPFTVPENQFTHLQDVTNQ